jgi:hypothetical protein
MWSALTSVVLVGLYVLVIVVIGAGRGFSFS